MNKLLAAAVVALIPLAGIAAEGEKTKPATPAGQSGSFDSLDSNKDGRISMPEASADPKLVEQFSSATALDERLMQVQRGFLAEGWFGPYGQRS